MKMNVEDLLNQIEDLLEEGKSGLGNRVRVNAESIRDIIADIRNSLPDEVIQARKVAAERKVILQQASDAAEFKMKQAEIQAKKLVEQSEITKQAQMNAKEIINEAKRQATELIEKAKVNSNEIVENAQRWASELRTGASNFVETIMSESDEILAKSIEDFSKSLNKVRIASQQLKAAAAKKNESN